MGIFIGQIQIAGTFGEAIFPTRTQLEVKKAHASRANFILVRNSGGAEHNGERAELFVLATVALTVLAIEEQAEERQFVRMIR